MKVLNLMPVALSFVLGACANSGSSGGPCQINQAAAFDLKFEHRLIFVPVTIQGAPTQALLDTGAEKTAVADSLVKRLRLPNDLRNGTVMSGVGGLGKERHDAMVDGFLFAGYDPGIGHYAVVDDPEPLGKQSSFAAILGGDIVSRHLFSALVAGRDRFDAPQLTILDRTLYQADMLLGQDYLHLRHVWISYSSGQLFVAEPKR